MFLHFSLEHTHLFLSSTSISISHPLSLAFSPYVRSLSPLPSPSLLGFVFFHSAGSLSLSLSLSVSSTFVSHFSVFLSRYTYLSFSFFFNSITSLRVQHDRLALTIKIVVLNSPRLPNNAALCIPMNAQYASEKMDNCSQAPYNDDAVDECSVW